MLGCKAPLTHQEVALGGTRNRAIAFACYSIPLQVLRVCCQALLSQQRWL